MVWDTPCSHLTIFGNIYVRLMSTTKIFVGDMSHVSQNMLSRRILGGSWPI